MLDLSGFLILPGLINAHDHLELNLLPRLGAGPYPNAASWATDIYHPDRSPIKQHLAVPKPARLVWGAIKNLLSGVTTVAHHNAYHAMFSEASFPVRVVRRYGWAHSLVFSPDWRSRFSETASDAPFVIHAGEGTDESSAREMSTLTEQGVSQASLVLVHGVAFGSAEWERAVESGASLVWCPSSNYFTLGRTVDVHALPRNLRVAIGTDSAITNSGDLLDELLVVRETLDAQRIYEMVTTEPARILRLPRGFGEIRDNGPADLLILRDNGRTPAESLLTSYPQLVMIAGRISLASTEFSTTRLSGAADLHLLEVSKRGSYRIRFDVHSLMRQTAEVLKEDPCLAGKAIAA